jgi:hypothetical protein
VSTNLLFLFSRQPRPARGRANGVILLQVFLLIYGAPREGPRLTLVALREAGAEKTHGNIEKGCQSTTYLRYVASPK